MANGAPGRPRRVTCRKCERHVDECGSLSARGLCLDCGIGETVRNAYGLHNMERPYLDRWRRGVIEAAGGILPDDLERS